MGSPSGSRLYDSTNFPHVVESVIFGNFLSIIALTRQAYLALPSEHTQTRDTTSAYAGDLTTRTDLP